MIHTEEVLGTKGEQVQSSVDSLRQALQAETNRAAQADLEVASLREEMSQWRQHAANLEARIEGQDNAIRELAIRNAHLAKERHEKQAALEAIMQANLDDNAHQGGAPSERIAELAAENNERFVILTSLLDDRGARITALQRDLSEVEREIESLQTKLESSEGRVDELLVQVTEMQAKSAEHDSHNAVEITRRDAQIGVLEGEIAHRERLIASLLGSTSWRVTAPLRAAKRLISGVDASVSPPIPLVAAPMPEPALSSVAEGATQSIATPETIAPPVDSNAHDATIVQDSDEDFDAEYYVNLYPDVKEAQLDPYRHFIDYGRAEGRSGRPARLKLRTNAQGLHPARDCVLVVSHEASRTGAPVLAWNICRELRSQFNVIALLLGNGELEDHFVADSDVVVGPYNPGERDPRALTPVIEELRRRYPIRTAIVNSLASRAVLEPLAKCRIPSVLLIHEFFKFHCSPDELVDAMAWAGATVFSAEVVRANAAIERTRPAANLAYIIPQGKSVIPRDPKLAGAVQRKSEVADVIARRGRKPFIVLGAGTVEYRKGVDLFIATAAEIQRMDPETDILMVWVGRMVDVYRQYANYIEEQIQRSGLMDRVLLAEATPDLEEIYQLADACLISSRLDPLPNIAIDAMAAGLPVLCFEKASGVAENLVGDELTRQCVLPFLNTEEAARRIVELYRDPHLRANLSDSMRKLAKDRFDMSRYVKQLVELGRTTRERYIQQEIDIQTLNSGHEFIAGFYLPPESRTSRADAIAAYVKSNQSGIYARKATPGFYPHVYAEHHGLTEVGANPLAHFVRAGKPAGPWQLKVIDASGVVADTSSTQRVAVHIHAFYPDMLADIMERLEFNDLRCDLFVSAPTEEAARAARHALKDYARGAFDVRVVTNRGRDIGPMVTEFAKDLQAYDVIGHFHTKKSLHVAGSPLVRHWIAFLMESLLGTTYPAARSILAAFAADPKVGLIFADDPNMIGWDKNYQYAEKLAAKMGIHDLPSQFFSFPVGTMFWARPVALKPLFDLGLDWDDYPAEPLPIDGTMLHALERMLPAIAQHAGFESQVSYAPGVSR
ncbi:glycosyl transferase family 1 [Paraburkholderia silvatlantica]|uniref:Glycosyl transferase family 1 n=1 Tax=Paraburkholderia silvatlantica TaxID=321895 RepID=A0A2V4TLQ0_9BURK|nr:rhamnan synthesis F family protein [Paraburkholderia silvatlantica]PYE16603.1 glycosyl transferase family 1 [Paraburkholderia silvatlantica]